MVVDFEWALVVAAASAVRTVLATTLFTVRIAEEPKGTVEDGAANDETLGGWSAIGAGGKKLSEPLALVVGGMGNARPTG